MYYRLHQNLDEREKKQIYKVLSKFLTGEPMLTYTNEDGFAVFIDTKKAILLDFNLKDVKGIVYPDYLKGIAMTIVDAVFVRHLLRLRSETLANMKWLSLPWTLKQCYFIELSNGKRFSLPTLLSKYISTACRDSITLSSGLWKFMWYYKITFNLPAGELKIVDDGTVKSMLQANFDYNGGLLLKGTVIKLNEKF